MLLGVYRFGFVSICPLYVGPIYSDGFVNICLVLYLYGLVCIDIISLFMDFSFYRVHSLLLLYKSTIAY